MATDTRRVSAKEMMENPEAVDAVLLMAGSTDYQQLYEQYVVARKVSGNPDGLIGWMRRWLDLADLYGMWQWPEDAQR